MATQTTKRPKLKESVEDIRRMSAASLSRQQGRSNLTGEQLKNGVGPVKSGESYANSLKINPTAPAKQEKPKRKARRRNEMF
jgi:hypothetical protein